MSISANIINGRVVANYTEGTSVNKQNTTGSDSLNKDAFLNILCAEMQYQDPLEPSSNTDWVSQMASFSTIEELQDLGDSVNNQGATDLVGKRVILAVASNVDGSTNYVTGTVQSVEMQSDGIYLSVNDYLYKYENLYAVVDENYYSQLMNDNGSNN